MASADKLKELLANINGRFDSIEMNSIAGGVLIEQGYNKNMIKVKDNRIVKYIVTWRSKSAPVRRKASFIDSKIAESFYQEKQTEGKSPSLYVTELVESTRQLK